MFALSLLSHRSLRFITCLFSLLFKLNYFVYSQIHCLSSVIFSLLSNSSSKLLIPVIVLFCPLISFHSFFITCIPLLRFSVIFHLFQGNFLLLESFLCWLLWNHCQIIPISDSSISLLGSVYFSFKLLFPYFLCTFWYVAYYVLYVLAIIMLLFIF